MNKKLEFIVTSNRSLKEELQVHISRRFYRHLKFTQSQILVNGQLLKLHEQVQEGDRIEIILNDVTKDSPWPISLTLPEVVYEDEHYLVVYKRAGILTIPTKKEPSSLFQEVLRYLHQDTAHILNRLDKETEGLVVVAKDRYAAYLLQPTHEKMIRKYICYVHGEVQSDGHIENYISRIENTNKRQISNAESGKIAVSDYKVLQKMAGKTKLEFLLQTGRTHQIRVQTSHMGHPIIGDTLYGEEESGPLMLASYFVSFVHPFTKEKIIIQKEPRW